MWPWPSLPEQMFQMAFLLFIENICATLFWNPCIIVEVMARTSSIYDLIIWSSSLILTFKIPEQTFQMAFQILKENNCAKLFWNPCINVEVTAQTRSIYDHFIIWLSHVTLTFTTWTNVSNGISTLHWEHLCHIILKSMHNCRSYGSNKLHLWPYSLIFKFDLDLQNTWTNFSNGISNPQGEQLCKIILKSMHKCRSDGPDTLNLCPIYHLTFKYDLDLQPTWKNVSTDTSSHHRQQLRQIILKRA